MAVVRTGATALKELQNGAVLVGLSAFSNIIV